MAIAGEGDDFAIDGLLASELGLADQPPDGGMEPERGADGLLGDGDDPVATAHVQQLVADDGFLNIGRQFGEAGG